MIDPTLKFDNGFILIQSCDDEQANIGVFSDGKCAYFHVALPSLIKEQRGQYSTELSGDYFDLVLQSNRIAVLDLIEKLNADGGRR